MSTMLTVRMDSEVKQRATEILQRDGYTLSSAVQSFLEYVVRHNHMPFDLHEKPSPKEVERLIEAFDQCHTKKPFTLTDEQIREARLKDRYGIDA